MKTTKTTVILFKSDAWTLATYKGDTIMNAEFPTAKSARAYAKSKGWNVRRAADCDA